MRIYLGLDIGSTAVKATAINESGAVVSRGGCDYPTYRNGVIAEQNAPDWKRSALTAVKEALSGTDGELAAISFSSQGGSLTVLDRDREALIPAITWMDQRSSAEAEEIIGKFGADYAYRSCGWINNPADCVSKTLWIKKNRPEIFEKAAAFVTTQEYVTEALTGNCVTDKTGEAMTRYFDIAKDTWNTGFLDFLGIDETMLPKVRPAGEFVGYLKPDIAEELGVGKNVKVYNGAHDQYCASIGSGVVAPGELLLATGTAWVLFGVAESKLFSKPGEPRIAPGVSPAGKYGAMASLTGMGGYADAYATSQGHRKRDLDVTAKDVMTDMLICPTNAPKLFIPHDPAFMAGSEKLISECGDVPAVWRAMLEGAAFEAVLAAREFARQGMNGLTKLVMSGGAVRSALWVSIVSASFGKGIYITTEHNTPALGAALIAAVSDGALENYASASDKLDREYTGEPDPALAAYYAEKLARYKDAAIL